MKNNNNQNQLLQLRSEIDAIDSQIINLLNQRIQVVKKVAVYKKNNQEHFLIKSAREADMIKSLIKKAEQNIPKSVIVNIWRKIITCANNLEQKLTISIHNPNKISDYQYLVREYYGDFIPLNFHENAGDVILAIEKDEAQIGIFALPLAFSENDSHQNWWINLSNNQNGLIVFAKIPFINQSKYQLVAVAKKTPEKSKEDQTLLLIEINKNVSKFVLEEILRASNLQFKILHITNLNHLPEVKFYLLEILGFFDKTSPEIINFCQNKIKPFVKIIGHFASPIEG